MVLALLLLPAAYGRTAHAVSCTTGAALAGDQRSALFDAAHQLGGAVLRGDAAALKAATIPSVAGNFDGIAATVQGLTAQLQGATLTVTSLYGLNADDLKGSEDDVQFFCSVPGAPLLVTVTLSELPKGQFALAILHATGVPQAQQFALILQNTGTATPHWQLAGFFVRPLTMDGHDSTWFWQQARVFKSRNQPWSAFFYDQAADYLARPADLFTSNNLQKLSRETAAVEPAGLPGKNPMMLPAGDRSFAITGLRADATLHALDLRIDAKVESVSDPVTARKDALTLMTALLQQHPELRSNFHGLWVYESTAAGQTFAVEQPMSALVLP
ncbi:hypothetical protein D1Y84_16915 [Acidipila sp. EB88]|nr:hypothetical protein D1Y84_16915 [Acidipila sp. EB88]